LGDRAIPDVGHDDRSCLLLMEAAPAAIGMFGADDPVALRTRGRLGDVIEPPFAGVATLAAKQLGYIPHGNARAMMSPWPAVGGQDSPLREGHAHAG